MSSIGDETARLSSQGSGSCYVCYPLEHAHTMVLHREETMALGRSFDSVKVVIKEGVDHVLYEYVRIELQD